MKLRVIIAFFIAAQVITTHAQLQYQRTDVGVAEAHCFAAITADSLQFKRENADAIIERDALLYHIYPEILPALPLQKYPDYKMKKKDENEAGESYEVLFHD